MCNLTAIRIELNVKILSDLVRCSTSGQVKGHPSLQKGISVMISSYQIYHDQIKSYLTLIRSMTRLMSLHFFFRFVCLCFFIEF